ncbi:MAG: alpha-1,2-fucosyltransferase [Crocinitomicaceae bacterium]|nr:alpha-1,2-fucosyltransferase [Crocinitomicaceae bacterium]
MITCNLKGGLGNQLFQIFAIISCAIQHNIPFCFTSAEYLGGESGGTRRFTFWNTFLKELRPYTLPSIHSLNPVINVNWGQFEYNPLPYNEHEWHDKTIMYDGYFQSYKYFQRYEKEIFENFLKLSERKKECRDRYPELFDEMKNYDTTISMHFRLGDYKHFGFFHPIMSLDYYKKALSTILLKIYKDKEKEEEKEKEKEKHEESSQIKCLVLYFCEAEDNDIVKQQIEELVVKFPMCTFQKVYDKMEDYNQMLCMSDCNHNIIANSSFSWFGAYLNASPEKIVCYPKLWFCGHGEHINTTDLFPTNWIKID